MGFLRFATFSCLLLTASCTANSPNSLFLTDEDLSSNEKLSEAKYLFDKGEYTEAETMAKEVYESNINKENAAILLSYIKLSQAGFDPFTLSKNIMSSSEEDDSINTETGTSDGLLSMSKILNLVDSDYESMSTSEEPLGSYTVYIPDNDLDSIRANPQLAIYHLNEAISYMCPYITEDVKLNSDTEQDSRHTATSCDEDTAITTIKGHFAWSLAHLAEALVFYSVTMYSEDGANPNITKFSTEIADLSTAEFVSSISTLSNIVDSIFPDSNESMSAALFNDLETVNSTIAYIGSQLPSSISNGLLKVTASIDTVQSVNSEISASSEIKNALTKKLSEKLAKEVEDQNLSGTDLTTACEALEAINSEITLPDSCS